MSTEPGLPAELAEFEAKLRSRPLPIARVDRDQLMYQAGWAAAEAARNTGWLWPVTSGVLAASVMVLGAMLAWRSDVLQVVRVEAAPAVEKTMAEEIEAPQSVEPLDIPAVRPRTWLGEGYLATWKRRSLNLEDYEPTMANYSGDFASPESKTARELMQEMLAELGQGNAAEVDKQVTAGGQVL